MAPNRLLVPVLILGALFVAGCSSSDTTTTSEPPTTTEPAVTATTTATESTAAGGAEPASQFFPDVTGVTATRESAGTWTFAVTISSPYDSPAQYADAWRILGPDGTEYGIRVLTHDHASEQPFTRSQSGIDIPAGVSTVTVQGRDLVNGWGGRTVELDLSDADTAG